jgi:hypothetical protein
MLGYLIFFGGPMLLAIMVFLCVLPAATRYEFEHPRKKKKEAEAITGGDILRAIGLWSMFK